MIGLRIFLTLSSKFGDLSESGLLRKELFITQVPLIFNLIVFKHVVLAYDCKHSVQGKFTFLTTKIPEKTRTRKKDYTKISHVFFFAHS